MGAVSSSSQVRVDPGEGEGEGVTLHPYIQAGDTAGAGERAHPRHCWILLLLVTTCMRPYAVLR